MNDHIAKPVDPDELFATISRWAVPKAERGNQPTPTPMEDHDHELPAIPGIDIAQGLRRVAGNHGLYRNLLRQFAAGQVDTATRIQAALNSDNQAAAGHLVHTVKGVAGNLAITEVHAAAQDLEKAIRDSLPSMPTAMEHFNAQIERQLSAIREALGEDTGSSIGQTPTSPFDPDRAGSAIKHLRQLLDACDGNAQEAVPELVDAVIGKASRQDLESLQVAISGFEFESALARLDSIQQECELSGMPK
jgi:two-component system sensor histidine kinase/response regulator